MPVIRIVSCEESEAPEDLTHHRCLNYGHVTAPQHWELTTGEETSTVPIVSYLCSNNGDVLREAALKGNGITLLPTFIVGDDIKSGRLRLVLASHAPTSLAIYALYAPNRYLAAKTRLLIDFLVARFNRPSWDDALASDRSAA